MLLGKAATRGRKFLTCLFDLCLVVSCMPFPNVCGKRKKIIFFAARMNTLRGTCAFHVIKEEEQEGENHGREAATMWPQFQKSTVDLSTRVQPSDVVTLCQPQSSQLRVKQLDYRKQNKKTNMRPRVLSMFVIL